MLKKLTFAVIALGAVATTGLAQVVASDDFETGTFPNTGSGWSDAWTSNNGQQFLTNSEQIDGTASLGEFGNTFSSRHLSSAITTGALTVSWSLKSLAALSASGNNIGFQLLGPSDTVLITFKFQNGTNSLVINDGGSDFSPGGTLSFSAGAIYDFSVSVNPGANNQYSFTATQRGGGTDTGTNFTLSSGTPTSVNGVRFFANEPAGSGNDAILDNVLVAVPEPSSIALLGGPAILGALFFARRRRA